MMEFESRSFQVYVGSGFPSAEHRMLSLISYRDLIVENVIFRGLSEYLQASNIKESLTMKTTFSQSSCHIDVVNASSVMVLNINSIA